MGSSRAGILLLGYQSNIRSESGHVLKTVNLPATCRRLIGYQDMDSEHTIPAVQAPEPDDSAEYQDPIERWLALAELLLGKKSKLFPTAS